MALPIAPVIYPSSLSGLSNGQLPLDLLEPVHARGSLHKNAARGWRALVGEAGRVGLSLTFTYGGMYRTYQEQYNLFMQRYTTTYIANRPTKKFQGKTWYLKPGMATAAVPGTSNHGWGLAIDTAFDTDPVDGLGPDDAAYIASHPKWPWFLEAVPRMGFSWELQSEPWHIRWVVGDFVPQAVVDYEASLVQHLEGYTVIAVADKFEFASAPRWDTRGFGNPLPAGEYTCKLDGSEGKTGATVNLTIVGATAAGFASAWASGPRPNTSKVNYLAAGATANEVSVPLAADGTFKIFISSPAHIIVDLTGYWS